METTTTTTTPAMDMTTPVMDMTTAVHTAKAGFPVLQGRVFERQLQFDEQPPVVQQLVNDCCDFLTGKKEEVFQTHHSSLIKSVLGVRYKNLYEIVESWLKTQFTDDQQRELREDEFVLRVKKVVEGLVLCGYLTPCKESSSPRKRSKSIVSSDSVPDNELYVPVEKNVADFKSTSVWDVVEGAAFAAWLKRKHGLLAPFTHGKDVYVVVNKTTGCVHLFESDVARGPMSEFQLSNLYVSHDSSHFECGVKLFNEDTTELINAAPKELQDAFVAALVSSGAHYREMCEVDVSKVSSFYDLKDYDMNGKEVRMEQYRGQVVLVVNVACESAYTEENYKQLVELDNKYRSRGLSILAFPCNQFREEPGSNVSIANFVKQFGCQFDFFEKGDVNGANARPVFVYLKKELPGLLGSYIKWNFTKFLIDHKGKPVQRYSPKDLPLTLEDAIKNLLAGTNEEDTPEQQPEHDETKLMTKQDREPEYNSDEDNQAITEGFTNLNVDGSPSGEKTNEPHAHEHHKGLASVDHHVNDFSVKPPTSQP